jgi:hypothetical protein
MKTLFLLSALGLMAAAGEAPASGAGKPADKKKVKVKVIAAAIGEGDHTHLQGETFETTAERAAALGDSVEIL